MIPMHFPHVLGNAWIGPVNPGQTRPAVPKGLLTACSDMAARLRELDERFALADFDQERVDALRRAIAEGRFVIDPGAIADGMLHSIVPTRNKN